MNTFQELLLKPVVLEGINACGYTKPYPIQERAIAPLISGLDVIGQAKTGSGKTAAYAIPMIQRIDTQRNFVQALVVAPTRELSLQITNEIRRLGKFTETRSITIYGGQSITRQFEALRRGAHVVVGTPGRLIDHLKRGTLELDSVKFVVLDEADTMLDMGFIDDIKYILNAIPRERQLCLFSATMPERIIELSRRYMQNPEKILIDSDEPSVETLDQYYTIVNQQEKQDILIELLNKENPSSAIIFCRTKRGTHKLARELAWQRLNVVPLHGDLSQHQREQNLQLFRSGRADILVATDVASRGIDILRVDCIVNFDLPLDPLLYFHRVGRTARAGGSGRSFTFVQEHELGEFDRIRNLTKAQIKPLKPEDKRTIAPIAPNRYDTRRRDYRNRPRHRYTGSHFRGGWQHR